jgi:hypothetical protein
MRVTSEELKDFQAAADTVFVRHRMPTERNANLLDDDVVAMLTNDMTTGQSIAQYLFDGKSDALHTLAGAEYVNAPHLAQVEDFCSAVRIAWRDHLGEAHDQLAAVDVQEAFGIVIGVGGLQACLKYLKHGLASSAIAVRGQRRHVHDARAQQDLL